MPTRGRTATGIGNTRGGRGRLPSNIQSMGDYYRSGRASAFNPRGTVRDANGRRLSGRS